MKQAAASSKATTARTASVEQLTKPKQERAVQTRARILTAAAELFARDGFSSTSITDIAQRVGMTKGAVYFHYKNKEDIAVAVVEAHYQRWPKLLDEVQAQGLEPLPTLYLLLDRTMDAFAHDILVQAGTRLQAERTLINARLPQPYLGWTELLTPLLAEGQEAGQIRTDLDATALARIVVAAFFGMQHISDVLQQRADLPERWAEIRLVVLGALALH